MEKTLLKSFDRIKNTVTVRKQQRPVVLCIEQVQWAVGLPYRAGNEPGGGCARMKPGPGPGHFPSSSVKAVTAITENNDNNNTA